jgi:ubiquitin C-terminal hydrolase
MNHINNKVYPKNSIIQLFKNIDQNQINLKFFLDKLNSLIDFEIFEQNDANEIYVKLIEIFEKEDEELSNLFNGVIKNIYTCEECNNKRYYKEKFSYLTLYVKDDNLHKGLKTLFKKEHLKDIKCDYCKKNTLTETRSKIVKWPAILIFLINRHSLNGKLNAKFDYTRYIELDISGNISKYYLNGIINHYGSADIGHYTYIIIDKLFTQISDDKISNVDNFKSINNYILSYNLKT